MPWSKKQHNAFEARAHGEQLNKPSLNSIPPGKAAQMAGEGIKGAVAQAAKKHAVKKAMGGKWGSGSKC